MSLVVEADPDVLLAALQRQYPGVPSWRGEFTGTWWALLGDRLVEAPTARELAACIRQTLLPSWPPRRPQMDVRRVREVAPGPPLVTVGARLMSADVPSGSRPVGVVRARAARHCEVRPSRRSGRQRFADRVLVLLAVAVALVGVAWDVVSLLCG